MAQSNRFLGGMALSVAVVALSLAGCGTDTVPPVQKNPLPSQSFAQAGTGATPTVVAGTTGGVARTSPVAAGGSLPQAQAGVGGVSAAAGGAAKPPVTGTGPAPTGAAGTAAVVATTPTPGVPWDPKASLDASGNLMPPADGQGFQIATPMFDLAPGQELFKCFHVAVPTADQFPVGEWDAQMSPGSHHFILYRSHNDSSATEQGVLTGNACTQGFGGTTWLYTQGSPRSHLAFPDGVAMELTPHEKLNFDMHYINLGSTTIHARIVLNANKVKTEMYQKADAQISFNVGINVPPHGTQTVNGDCTPAAGAKYFVMQTHTHKFATLAVVNRKMADGKLGEELVRTMDWDNPQAHVWQQEPFLTFQPGEKFHYSCSYKNDTAATVTVGISADVNEMCMAEAYFFPASATTPQCN